MQTIKETLNAQELADFLGVSVGFIYNVRSSEPDSDKIPKGHLVGRRIIWIKSEVLEWLSRH